MYLDTASLTPLLPCEAHGYLSSTLCVLNAHYRRASYPLWSGDDLKNTIKKGHGRCQTLQERNGPSSDGYQASYKMLLLPLVTGPSKQTANVNCLCCCTLIRGVLAPERRDRDR